MDVNSKVQHIVNWLKKYQEEAKIDGFVVGISGGIDSAVTSTLCAMTGIKTVCLSLPIHQNIKEIQRVNEHFSWLIEKFNNIETTEVDLTNVLESFSKIIPREMQTQLNMANLRSRIRMCALYLYSGYERKIVVGTGNKVEDFGVGFFTKYGDGGVDVSPIADLLKSEVYEIAKHIGIIESIILAEPTDGLHPDSPSDEEKIGASYDELEWAMSFYSENKQLPTQNFSDREKKVLQIYKKLNTSNHHKMIPIPVCLMPKNIHNYN